MKKSARIFLYDISLGLIALALGILFMKYVIGAKGMYNRAGQYISLEGFQSIKKSSPFTDAYVITMDKYPDRF